VGVKNRGGIVTRTDALGTYKVPGFGKEIDPKDVEVTCDKNGYKQARVVRHSSPSTDPKIPIETECTNAVCFRGAECLHEVDGLEPSYEHALQRLRER
jgi:hypothetical protein